MPCVRLPIEVRSVVTARGLLTETLRQHGAESQQVAPAAADDAVLMLSELVTNAVRHARALLALEITIHGSTLHVAVADDAPGLPAVGRHDLQATGGRGLTIVDALADRWGFVPGRGHKTVWFDLALIYP